MHVQGDRALESFLKALGPTLERRIIRQALKAGGAQILKRAKQLAPKGKTGNLRRSLAVSRGRRIRKYPHGNLVAILGPSWPLGAHGHLIEKGTRLRKTKDGASRGRMPAQPFMGPAFEGRKERALRVLREKIRQGIKRELAKVRQGK